MQQKSYGFTLIELIIVVVIIAILSTLTVSLYSNSVAKSYYNKAQSQLGNLALSMQSQFYISNHYINLIASVPPQWTETNDRYIFTVAAAALTATTFEVTAALKPAFTGPRELPTCGLLTIKSTGEKLPVECWK